MSNQTILMLILSSWAFLAHAQISTVSRQIPCPLQEFISSVGSLQVKGNVVRAANSAPDSPVPRLLRSLASTPNLRLRREEVTVLGDPGKAVFILDLLNTSRPDDRLFLYYVESTNDTILLHATVNEKGQVELRLWAGGDKAILVTEEKSVIEPLPPQLESAVWPLLAGNADVRFTSVSDALTCLARAFGISLDTSSITNLLSSATCSARDTWSLYKTAAHCVSAFSIGTATVVSTAFCITGLGIDIACNLINCNNSPNSPSSCIQDISPNSSVQGAWTNNCPSQHRAGRYAKYFSFTISQASQVRINLRSPGIDNYLYLLSGSGTNGSVIADDDDSLGNYQASIDRALSPGTYTIEATTFTAGVTGNFVLELTATSTSGSGSTPPQPGNTACISGIALNTSVRSNFAPGCASTYLVGHYAKYFVFSLTERATVQIDLMSSSVDTFLILRSGGSPQGPVIAYDDDGGSGVNSRLIRTLEPGTYTLECTTYAPGTSGDFIIAIMR